MKGQNIVIEIRFRRFEQLPALAGDGASSGIRQARGMEMIGLAALTTETGLGEGNFGVVWKLLPKV